MAVIYCPQCDSEIPEKVAICPSCGFNLDTYDEEEQDEQFNSLLNAANKKLSEDNGEPAPEGEKSNSTISQSQIDALLGGNIVDLSGSGKPKKTVKKESEKPLVSKIAEEKPLEKEKAEEKSPEAAETAVKEAAEETETFEAAPAVSAPAAKKKKSGNISAIVTVAAVVVALALGFCISLLMFGNVIKTPEESFAIKAANAVNSKLSVNENLCVYKAYVKLGAASDECIIYAITDYKDTVSASKYRVVINKEDENIINIYYTVDENSAEYLAMKNSEDPEVRIQASVLKNYSDSIEDAHREISIGTPSWKSVDISTINSNITSRPTKNTAEE
ncbi:MAG: hypothetical protein IJX15_06975 [Ruminiclostridium sp.]|nr:hypothetical protein [Ruminiclostridium sp.]